MKRTVGREHYFTAPDLARRCVAYAGSLRPLDSYGLVVEPSAGTGAFLDLLPPDRRVGIDLDPRHPQVQAADFLGWRPPADAGPVLTIGNPPFGQRGALAVRFLAHACSFSDTVAFILPRSFNKWTFANRVDPWFGLAGSFDCDGFVDAAGRLVSVRTVFQVWQRLPEPRRIRTVERHRVNHRNRLVRRLAAGALHGYVGHRSSLVTVQAPRWTFVRPLV